MSTTYLVGQDPLVGLPSLAAVRAANEQRERGAYIFWGAIFGIPLVGAIAYFATRKRTAVAGYRRRRSRR